MKGFSEFKEYLSYMQCYSLISVGYQLMTFNDCKEAADEIKQEIQTARRDLASKGFKF